VSRPLAEVETAPLCECGCGESVRDRRNGIWSRWRPGHSGRSKGARDQFVDAAPEHRPAGVASAPEWPHLIDGTQLSFDDLD